MKLIDWSILYPRLPDSIHGKQTWRQHFVSESSDSENSDDDLKAYAAAAGGALEDSDEDIFSVQLPDSPESYNEPGTSAAGMDHSEPLTDKTSYQTCTHHNEEDTQKSKVKEDHKHTRKGTLTTECACS